jgi:hypothetical protein
MDLGREVKMMGLLVAGQQAEKPAERVEAGMSNDTY